MIYLPVFINEGEPSFSTTLGVSFTTLADCESFIRELGYDIEIKGQREKLYQSSIDNETLVQIELIELM